MSMKRIGQTQNWQFGRVTGALIDGLTADTVKNGYKREITQMKDLQLHSWIREGSRTSGKMHLAHRLGTTGDAVHGTEGFEITRRNNRALFRDVGKQQYIIK